MTSFFRCSKLPSLVAMRKVHAYLLIIILMFHIKHVCVGTVNECKYLSVLQLLFNIQNG